MLLRSKCARQSVELQRLPSLAASPRPLTCPRHHARLWHSARNLAHPGQDPRSRRRSALRSGLNRQSGRSLATALGDYSRLGPDSTFQDLSGSYSSPSWHIRPFDPTAPLIVKDTIDIQRSGRKPNRSAGLPGEVGEAISVFEACVQVGKLDRAMQVLKYLRKGGTVTRNELTLMHHAYLKAAIERIIINPGLDQAEDLHKWFEIEIRGAQHDLSTETVAYMLKASLLTSHGSRLIRLVERYMGMLNEGSGFEDLLMTDILSAQDLGTLGQICPDYTLSGFEADGNDIEGMGQAEDLGDADHPLEPSMATEAVLATPQKSPGLRTVKQTVSLFSKLPPNSDIAELPLEQRRELQSQLERDCVDAAMARWREENDTLSKMGTNTQISTGVLNARLHEWQTALDARLKTELELIDAAETTKPELMTAEDPERCMYGPFLRQSTPSRLAAVTILSVVGVLTVHGTEKGIPITTLINQVGRVVEEDIKMFKKSKDSGSRQSRSQKLSRTALRATRASASPLTQPPTTEGLRSTSRNIVDAPVENTNVWPISIRTKVGAALVKMLSEVAKVVASKVDPVSGKRVSQVQRAFAKGYQFRKGRKIAVCVPNKVLLDLLAREPSGDFLARHLPMVVEPRPWTKFDEGGFLEYTSTIARVKQGEKDAKVYFQAAIEQGHMDQVFKGLDVLGRTAWQINQPVFDVMLKAWNTGEAFADIPPLNPDMPPPPQPADILENPKVKFEWLKDVKAIENKKSGYHSNRCFMNFQMEIAQAFRHQTFYFPHNVDFRGRAYPIPPYLNHMGADSARGILKFAKGRELGEQGLSWLRIQLANVYGLDKASLSEREEFTKANMENILESARNPLDGSRWWLQAEDPWQCLAACFELAAASKIPDPTKFVSHLPVHMDGTCNGLQHYAALGGDSWGARQVNLEPGDRPADVYAAVAALVTDSVKEDLKMDNPFAKALHDKITRKVVKQTVMTNVYGVTYQGAKLQIQKQLNDLYPTLEATTGIPEHQFGAYLATKVFKALASMFSGAHDIQYWLGEVGSRVCRSLSEEQVVQICDGETLKKTAAEPKPKATRSKRQERKRVSLTATAKEISENLGDFRATLVWTTPLRMPVVQPYRTSEATTINTCLADLTFYLHDRSNPVNAKKQLQGFPPNFVHSMDASHMLLSALACDAQGLTFAAVHDSFWTHAADVGIMNSVLRDTFVRIHEEDVIGRLATEFETRYRGSMSLVRIDSTTAVAKQIEALRSGGTLDLREELIMEKKRQTLLASSNPKEVKQGKQMVTPASLVEQAEAKGGRSVVDMESLAKELGADEPPTVAVNGEDGDGAAMEPGLGSLIEEPQYGDSIGAAQEESAAEQDLPKASENRFEIRMNNNPKTRSKKTDGLVQIWMPFKVPPIPAKGDFDVSRLKGSQYFFS